MKSPDSIKVSVRRMCDRLDNVVRYITPNGNDESRAILRRLQNCLRDVVATRTDIHDFAQEVDTPLMFNNDISLENYLQWRLTVALRNVLKVMSLHLFTIRPKSTAISALVIDRVSSDVSHQSKFSPLGEHFFAALMKLKHAGAVADELCCWHAAKTLSPRVLKVIDIHRYPTEAFKRALTDSFEGQLRQFLPEKLTRTSIPAYHTLKLVRVSDAHSELENSGAERRNRRGRVQLFAHVHHPLQAHSLRRMIRNIKTRLTQDLFSCDLPNHLFTDFIQCMKVLEPKSWMSDSWVQECYQTQCMAAMMESTEVVSPSSTLGGSQDGE